MRSGISITLSVGDRQRLDAIVADRNTPQKHVWRARIVLLSADGLGTNAIMAATGKAIFESLIDRWPVTQLGDWGRHMARARR